MGIRDWGLSGELLGVRDWCRGYKSGLGMGKRKTDEERNRDRFWVPVFRRGETEDTHPCMF